MALTLKRCSRASNASLSLHVLSRSSRMYYTRTPSPPSPEFTQLLGSFASLPPRPTPLSTLLAFGAPLTPTSLLHSASYVLEELPRRLVQRVKALDALPFIVGMNPFIARNHELYRDSFQAVATAPPVTDLESNWEFVKRLETFVRAHANDVPTLARGFQEAAKYMKQSDIADFLDGAIRSRISIRFIAEQHIALTRALRESMQGSSPHTTTSGVMDSDCSAANMINVYGGFVRDLCEATFGVAPTIELEGMTDAKFKYVPVHIEYVLIEILKNAFRATVEHHHRLHGTSSSKPMPPVTATIALASLPPSPTPPSFPSSPLNALTPSSSPLSLNNTGTAPQYLTIRIRDQGGGVHPNDLPRVFSYAFTTARGSGTGFDDDEGMGGGPYAAQQVGGIAGAIEGSNSAAGAGGLFGEITSKGLQTGLGTLAGLGYGLPMARIYAAYFGGSLELVTLHGHGTDVFIKFRALDESTNLTL